MVAASGTLSRTVTAKACRAATAGHHVAQLTPRELQARGHLHEECERWWALLLPTPPPLQVSFLLQLEFSFTTK
jgi:hypothetical protein